MSELAKTERKTGLSLGFVNLTPSELGELDTEKLHQLLEMKRSEEDRAAEREFNRALSKFQSEMPDVGREREVEGKYRYAAFEDIWKIARPILAECGFAVSFAQEESQDTITVRCVASHEAGAIRETPFTLPKLAPVTSRAGREVTNKAQAQGSANSYAKRYAFCNAFNIVLSDEDDDGLGAGTATVTPDQSAEIRELVDQVEDETRVEKFWAWCGATNADEVPARLYGEAVRALDKIIKTQ